MTGPYTTIVADPPWQFDDELRNGRRGASSKYGVLTIPEIQRFPLPELAPDARLFLWRVGMLQEEAIAVLRTWGFKFAGEIVWIKTLQSGSGLAIGMGRQVRASHEVCIIGTRGKPLRLRGNVPSVIFAPRGAHSEKPDEFYELVERLSPGPYVELFGRRSRLGWDVEGDQAPRRSRA